MVVDEITQREYFKLEEDQRQNPESQQLKVRWRASPSSDLKIYIKINFKNRGRKNIHIVQCHKSKKSLGQRAGVRWDFFCFVLFLNNQNGLLTQDFKEGKQPSLQFCPTGETGGWTIN